VARRRVTRDKDEIEYRLLELVRHARAWGPEEIKARLFAILMLAKMWGVDLSNALIDSALENLKVPRVTLRGSYPTKEKTPEEVVPVPEKKDLTPKLEGGILAEMGYGEEDGDQKD
jgi:hypothetical protein